MCLSFIRLFLTKSAEDEVNVIKIQREDKEKNVTKKFQRIDKLKMAKYLAKLKKTQRKGRLKKNPAKILQKRKNPK